MVSTLLEPVVNRCSRFKGFTRFLVVPSGGNNTREQATNVLYRPAGGALAEDRSYTYNLTKIALIHVLDRKGMLGENFGITVFWRVSTNNLISVQKVSGRMFASVQI